MSNKNSKAINEDYELVDGDGGPFSGFDEVKFETWLRVGLEGYCLENKGAWAFPGAEAAIVRQDYLALGLRDAYHELNAEARAHFRHAVANVIASLEGEEGNVPIIEHLLLLASVMHASEILRVLPARVGNGFFGLTKNREGESLFAITLLTVAQLAAPRLEAVDCLHALIASRHFDNAYAGIALTALCHADDKDLVGHINLLREALADMFREFNPPAEYQQELARTVLEAVGLRNLVRALPRLKYFDPHNEHAPLDTWLFGACVGGKSPLLGRDETDVRHIYFYRPSKPSVRVRLPEVDKGLGDFIASLRDPTYEEPPIPIPLPMSMAGPRGAVTSHDRGRLFNQLKEQWERETANVSSVTRIILNDAYQRIIGMGPTALPMIFSVLKEEGGLWFPALKSITGADPVPEHERGDTEAMRQSWLDWATRNGYL